MTRSSACRRCRHWRRHQCIAWTNNLLNLTDKLATKRGDQFIASELFLLALLEDKGDAARLLKECGGSKQALEAAAIDAVRGGENVGSQDAEGGAKH